MSLEVPEGWRLTAFNNIASDVSMRNRGRDQIPVLSVTKYDGFVPSEEYFQKKVFSADTENYKIVRKGQFAYATIHLDEGSIDRLTRFDAGLISPMYTVFEIDERQADSDYILRLFKLYALNGQFDALGNGGVNRRKSISFSTLGKLSIPLPPLHEQRRIAEILSSVDEAIAATRAVIEQTRKVKQGVLERLLTKGIGHTHFKHTEIGEIPEGWEVRRLADLAEDTRNSFVIGPFGSDLTVKDYCDEGVPVVFVRDVQSDRFRWKSEVFVSPEKAERLRAHSARPGDIVITKMGLPPGIAAEIPPSFENSIVTADIVRLRPNTEIAASAFLALALNGERVADAVAEITGGQTRPKITLRDYKSISLALPPIEEQRDIVANVEPFKTLIEQEASKLDRLLVLKSALMSDLLTGRKRVTDALPLAAE